MAKPTHIPQTKGHAKAAGTGHGPIGRKPGAGHRRRQQTQKRLANAMPLNAAGTFQAGG